MTIKNTKKNISAEPGDVVLDVSKNILSKSNNQSNFSNNLILTITQQDFIDETNGTNYKTIEIPMSELVRLAYLQDKYYDKTSIDQIKQLYYTIEEIQANYYTKTETDNKIKIHLDVRDSLPPKSSAKTNYIYLIPLNDGGYKEYVYVESINDFEMIGSTDIDLTSYLQIADLNTELLNSANFQNLTQKANSNENNISTLNTSLDNLLNKLGFDQNGKDLFNFVLINTNEYWLLSNAKYDYTNNRFIKVNTNKESLGIQVKYDEMNIWRSSGRATISVPSPYNDNYDYTTSFSSNYIGALNNSTQEWENFDIPYGWENILGISQGIVLFAKNAKVFDENNNELRLLNESDYDDLLNEIIEYTPTIDDNLRDSSNPVKNSAIYNAINSINNSISNLRNISDGTFKTTLWDFIWGSSGFTTENGVTRGTTSLGSYIYSYLQDALSSLDTSIMTRVGNLLSSHDSDNSAHNDIRTLISNISYSLTSLTDSNAHENIGTNANASQADINTAIDSKIDTLATKESINSIIAGEIDLTGYVQDNDSRLTDSRTPKSHVHGNLTNNGTLDNDTNAINKIVVTDSSDNLKTINQLPANKVIHQDISGKIDTAGTGLAKDGTTLNHSNSIVAQTEFGLQKIKYDAQGHITETNNVEKSDITALGIPGQDTVYQHDIYASHMGGPNENKTLDFGDEFNVPYIESDTNGHVSNVVNRVITIPNTLGNGTKAGLSTNDYTTTEKDKLSNINAETEAYNIKMNGVQNAGSSANYARADHVHPTDNSRADRYHTHTGSELRLGASGSDANVTIQEVVNNKANSSHTHIKDDITDFPTAMTPTAHTDSDGEYGKATTSVYGHTKLSSTMSSSEELAATPKLVKSVYSLLSNKQDIYYLKYSTFSNPTPINSTSQSLSIPNNSDLHIHIFDKSGESQIGLIRVIVNNVLYSRSVHIPEGYASMHFELGQNTDNIVWVIAYIDGVVVSIDVFNLHLS